jgi:bifunctional DNA-binding transcriptional regulator/antitoxin component of YhaV-PrlF toxin-antitoxin module
MKMTDFDYKKYSLEKLQEWVHDALSTGEASPHEIYSAIREAVREDYQYYKDHSSRAYGLLELLSGYRPVAEKAQKSCDKDDPSPECKKSWNSFWEETDDGMRPWGHSDLEYIIANQKKDKITKWSLPVEVDEVNGEYFVSFPDDLLEAANLKEGDKVEWVDQGDGSYLLKKVEKQMTHDEMLDAGYWMTDDGVWIPPQK